MRKFKIQTDDLPIEPSLKQVQQFKNVERLYHDYEQLTKRGKKPIYRNPKLYLLLVLIGIVLLLLLFEEKF